MDNKHILNYVNQTPTGIPRNRIVAFGGATDKDVVLATGLNILNCGVSTDVPCDAAGERIDVIHDGFAYIEAGAAFSRGSLLGPDATGRAINAGQTWFTVGRALESATAAGHRVLCKVQMGNI